MTPFGKFPDRGLEDLGLEAVLAAVDDAGLHQREVQAVYAGHARTGRLLGRENGVGQLVMAAAGVRGIPVTGVGNFCASGSTAFREAVMAVMTGLYDVVLALGVEKLSVRPEKGKPLTSDGMELEGEFGFTPPAFFALVAQAYLEKTGASADDLAQVAVKNRAHAEHNPYAQYRKPLTAEEVLGSRMIADPLTLLSCCPTGDGAAAALVVSDRMARRLDRKTVRVEATSLLSGCGDPTATGGFEVDRKTAHAAYEQAGIDPGDIDVAEVHDAFTVTEVIHYEDLLLCPPGDGVKALLDGQTALGGRIPVSTSGGLMSKGHPLGATGIAQVHEIVTQLRGEAGARQVERATAGLTHCAGGFLDGDVAISAVHLFSV
ncbi:thiolase family protein [Actinomadura sp. LD22]|uniref:Thiolase family protein n=2 Tax=Actinomadura physcomitrii TaxID=2650748 RepID=A0A6I4MSQ6_9ACTN|nr:thiolase family protein [Actinomadura physcomitrii]